MAELLSRELLRSLAEPRSFERGDEYAESGAVGSLHWDDVSIRAGVQGTDRYRVRLEVASGKLAGSCTCPVGRDGLFCKHCVAVGLAWLSRSPERDEEATAPTRSQLHDRLAALGTEALAGLLVDQALDDEYLYARLLALTADAGPDSDDHFRRLEHAFDVAVDPGGFVAWNEAYGFAHALGEVIGTVEQQLGTGHGTEIVAFCEHALRRIEGTFGYVDDSGGELGDVKERLEDLHLAACREARPNPLELAERLFRWEVEGDWETFFGAVERYADVLGERGIARYRELAHAAWASEPELGPRSSRAWDSRRFRLSQIMEDLARAQNDVDALVAVLAQDRSSPYRYQLIAEALLAAGRAAEAIEWAERGLAAFEDRTDSRLIDFLCERYAEAGRHEKAIELAWESLEASGSLEAYKRLVHVALHADVLDSWRERGRSVLRRERDSPLGKPDRSELVAALLWDDDPEEAWREAKEGGCRRDLWLALGRARECDHPADAVEVYSAQIEPAIHHSDNHTYAGAVEWLEKVQVLLTRLEQEDSFEELTREIRERHRAKRNLIKQLDERNWGTRSQRSL